MSDAGIVRWSKRGLASRSAVRRILAAAVLAVLVAPLAAEAQQMARAPVIGFLESGSPASAPELHEGFRQGLRELGYVPGKSITLEYRWAEGKSERLPHLALELVRLRVDVIITHGGPTILAAKEATSTIPIVMAVSGDPVGEGFVPSLAKPGGNITGLSILATELSGKRLALLKEAVPEATRMAVLLNPANPVAATQLQLTREAAEALRVELQPLEVRSAAEIDRAFSTMAQKRAGGLLVLPDPMLHGQHRRIADLAARNRVPAMFWWREFAERGGLMAYGANRADLGRRTAVLVDKILKGARPADLPVEQPTKFELVINMKTAKALGLKIPPSLLLRADHVIE